MVAPIGRKRTCASGRSANAEAAESRQLLKKLKTTIAVRVKTMTLNAC